MSHGRLRTIEQVGLETPQGLNLNQLTWVNHGHLHQTYQDVDPNSSISELWNHSLKLTGDIEPLKIFGIPKGTSNLHLAISK